MPAPTVSSDAVQFVDQPWVEVLPWLDGYVSRKAAILEGLAPDLDWWFSQTPTETAADTDLDSLCTELARVFVARHPTERLASAFTAATNEVATRALGLGQRALGSLAAVTGHPVELLPEAPMSAAVLQFSVSELHAVPGLGHATVERIVSVLVRLSILVPIADRAPETSRSGAQCQNSVVYVEAPMSPLGGPEDLDHIRARQTSRAIDCAIAEIVGIEGPVSVDRLTRAIVRRFGYDRVSPRRMGQIKRKVPSAQIRRTPLGAFVWPDDADPATWRTFRPTPAGIVRTLEDIAPEEIANAMQAIASRPVPQDKLYRSTLAVFDRNRLTKQATARLDYCLMSLLKAGRIESDGLTYQAAKTTSESKICPLIS